MRKSMLVRNIKCSVCGGNKVSENNSTYIYCDYCGMWMGVDFTHSIKESMEVFSGSNASRPEVKEFLEISQKLGKVILDRDAESFIKFQCRMHELEFEIFPERFGPKAKQKAFRKKYLDFYSAFYNEVVDNEWFSNISSRNQQDLISKLKYSLNNGKVVYEFNEDFKKLIDVNLDIINRGFEKCKNVKALDLHPEEIAKNDPDLTRQISIMTFLQAFSSENVKQIIEYLGLKHNYIEIPDVSIHNESCSVCAAEIHFPEGAEKVVCENCGSINKTGTNNIQCLNCGSVFDFSVNPKCNYCGTLVEIQNGAYDVVSEKYSDIQNSVLEKKKEQKKSFFSRLFK